MTPKELAKLTKLPVVTLKQLQEAAEEAGEPEVVCVNCSNFYIRADGPVFMGRCSLRDEPQFAYGSCLEYELPQPEGEERQYEATPLPA